MDSLYSVPNTPWLNMSTFSPPHADDDEEVDPAEGDGIGPDNVCVVLEMKAIAPLCKAFLKCGGGLLRQMRPCVASAENLSSGPIRLAEGVNIPPCKTFSCVTGGQRHSAAAWRRARGKGQARESGRVLQGCPACGSDLLRGARSSFLTCFGTFGWFSWVVRQVLRREFDYELLSPPVAGFPAADRQLHAHR